MWLISLLLIGLTVTFPAQGVTVQTEPVWIVDGQLQGPTNPDALGVYASGNNLLLVGHVDWAGRLRIGNTIRNLSENDPIVLSGGSAFHVAWSGIEDIDDLQPWLDASAPSDEPELTLVTCTGPFSVSRHEYLQRQIVRAVT